MSTRSLSDRRLAWHSEQAAARDARFTRWNSEKLAAWKVELDAWLEGRDPRTLSEIKAAAWSLCECGRPFQRTDRFYRQCFTCNQVSYADGSVVCVICGIRRHATTYPTCAPCKPYEEAAQFLRPMVLVRDHFSCGLCGTDEGSMQIDHIEPGGSAFPWNLMVLCTTCDLIKGKQYGPLDELAKLELMEAYLTYLSCFLDDADRTILRQQYVETLGGDLSGPDPHVLADRRIEGRRYGTCDDIDGMLTVARMFKPTEVSHVER